MFQLPHHLITQFCYNEKRKYNNFFSFCKFLCFVYSAHIFTQFF